MERQIKDLREGYILSDTRRACNECQ